jgi:predicted metalloprotease
LTQREGWVSFSRVMRYDEDHESPDLIDERGEGGGSRMAGGSLLGLLPLLLRFKYGWVVIVLFVGYSVVHGALGGAGAGVSHVAGTTVSSSTHGSDKASHFVAAVLDDTQATWQKFFADNGQTYRHAKLVLFTGLTNTGCGNGDAATGPFYCPSDERVYIDLGFYDELAQRFGIKGNFAEAYVIAHEIGHHVQKLLGISAQVARAGRSQQLGATGLRVRLELQADCFAGIWARSTSQRQILEVGDVQEALGAAAAVGDDHIERETTGTVRPETWTHGSAAERASWFQKGFDNGTLQACDTFKATTL